MSGARPPTPFSSSLVRWESSRPFLRDSFPSFRPRLVLTGAKEQLCASGLVSLPSGPLKEDHVCREAFLAAFSTYLGIEALALAASEETVKRATLAVAKQSLVSLDCALLAFLKARLALRKEALKGHDLDSPHCLTLLKSTPFSVGLFGKDAVEDALLESRRLNIKMEELLKKPYKRPSSSKKSKAKRAKTSGPPLASTSTQSSRGASRGRGNRGGSRRGSSRGKGSGTGQSQAQNSGKPGSKQSI